MARTRVYQVDAKGCVHFCMDGVWSPWADDISFLSMDGALYCAFSPAHIAAHPGIGEEGLIYELYPYATKSVPVFTSKA